MLVVYWIAKYASLTKLKHEPQPLFLFDEIQVQSYTRVHTVRVPTFGKFRVMPLSIFCKETKQNKMWRHKHASESSADGLVTQSRPALTSPPWPSHLLLHVFPDVPHSMSFVSSKHSHCSTPAKARGTVLVLVDPYLRQSSWRRNYTAQPTTRVCCSHQAHCIRVQHPQHETADAPRRGKKKHTHTQPTRKERK